MRRGAAIGLHSGAFVIGGTTSGFRCGRSPSIGAWNTEPTTRVFSSSFSTWNRLHGSTRLTLLTSAGAHSACGISRLVRSPTTLFQLMRFFLGRPPRLPFSRLAAAFFALFILPSATAEGFLLANSVFLHGDDRAISVPRFLEGEGVVVGAAFKADLMRAAGEIAAVRDEEVHGLSASNRVLRSASAKGEQRAEVNQAVVLGGRQRVVFAAPFRSAFGAHLAVSGISGGGAGDVVSAIRVVHEQNNNLTIGYCQPLKTLGNMRMLPRWEAA